MYLQLAYYTIIACLISFIFFLELVQIGKSTQHIGDADVVPLLEFFTAELGEYFRDLVVFRGDHALGALWHVDVVI